MRKHTPAPWYWEEFDSPRGTAFIRSYVDLEDRKVAGACKISCADAAHIVQCVNERDSLLAQIASLREALEAILREDEQQMDGACSLSHGVVEQARAALKQVTP